MTGQAREEEETLKNPVTGNFLTSVSDVQDFSFDGVDI